MMKNRDRPLNGTLLVFIFLLSIYLLTYSGVPVSDDEHLFAAVSHNLAISSEFRADQLSGNQRLLGRYANVGPLHPLIGSLLVRAVWWADGLGAVQVLYFLSPIYTAATAALLYWYAERKGYSAKAGVFTALVFGLTTIAWPYAQTFYREPLAMLLFFSAFILFESLSDEIPSRLSKKVRWVLIALCFFGAVLTRIFILLTLPLFVILAYRRRKDLFGSRADRFWLYFWGGVGLLGAAWLVSSWLGVSQFSRLNPAFFTNRVEQLVSQFYEFLKFKTLQHFAGILLSPGKGLLIYSPILVFAALAYNSKRTELVNLLIPLGTLAIFSLAQVFYYQERWWNISWGTRFLLPVIPLLVAACLPIFDQLLTSSNKIGKGLLFGVAVLGFVIQLGGVLVSGSVYLEYIYTQKSVLDAAETIWNFKLMPALQHWALVFDGRQVNLAAARNFHSNPLVIFLLVVILVGVILFTSYLIWRRQETERPIRGQGFWLVGVYMGLILPVLLLAAYRAEPVYFPVWGNLSSASDVLSRQAQPGDIILVDGYQRPAWYHFMNYVRLEIPWYSLPEDSANWVSHTSNLLSALPEGSRVWILVEKERTPSLSSIIKLLESFAFDCGDYSLPPGENNSNYTLKLCD